MAAKGVPNANARAPYALGRRTASLVPKLRERGNPAAAMATCADMDRFMLHAHTSAYARVSTGAGSTFAPSSCAEWSKAGERGVACRWPNHTLPHAHPANKRARTARGRRANSPTRAARRLCVGGHGEMDAGATSAGRAGGFRCAVRAVLSFRTSEEIAREPCPMAAQKPH